MKLWIAVGAWDHEGHSLPIGIFETEELAKAALAKHRKRYDDTEIVEYELNKEQD